jgi:hypothetical protein
LAKAGTGGAVLRAVGIGIAHDTSHVRLASIVGEFHRLNPSGWSGRRIESFVELGGDVVSGGLFLRSDPRDVFKELSFSFLVDHHEVPRRIDGLKPDIKDDSDAIEIH